MGELWKSMGDDEKKPYFKEARAKALQHKKALEKHPELAYVPSKKKTKRNDKPPDEPVPKIEAKNPRTGSPVPSPSPHSSAIRPSKI